MIHRGNLKWFLDGTNPLGWLVKSLSLCAVTGFPLRLLPAAAGRSPKLQQNQGGIFMNGRRFTHWIKLFLDFRRPWTQSTLGWWIKCFKCFYRFSLEYLRCSYGCFMSGRKSTFHSFTAMILLSAFRFNATSIRPQMEISIVWQR